MTKMVYRIYLIGDASGLPFADWPIERVIWCGNTNPTDAQYEELLTEYGMRRMLAALEPEERPMPATVREFWELAP
jgi:hypothetical protein